MCLDSLRGSGSYKSVSISVYKRLLRRCFGSLLAGSCGRRNRRKRRHNKTGFSLIFVYCGFFFIVAAKLKITGRHSRKGYFSSIAALFYCGTLGAIEEERRNMSAFIRSRLFACFQLNSRSRMHKVKGSSSEAAIKSKKGVKTRLVAPTCRNCDTTYTRKDLSQL